MTKNTFPGDPRFARWISPCREDFSALSRRDYLSTNLLDSIVQRAAPPPDHTPSSKYHVGSLGVLCYMQSLNALIPKLDERTAQQRADRAKVARARKTMRFTFTAPLNRLLVPILLNDHFFVLKLDCSLSTPEFVLDATLYDSLRRRTRQINPEVSLIANSVNDFLHNFVLHDDELKARRVDNETFLRRLKYAECPAQLNGYDCGLFAVGVVLHLVEGKDVASTTFNQQQISGLRVKLASYFSAALGNELNTASQVVRNCFPQLRGSSILDSTGLEVISVPSRQHREEVAVETAATGTRRVQWESDVEGAVTVLAELTQDDVAEDVETREESDADSVSGNTGSPSSSGQHIESDGDDDGDDDGVEEGYDKNVTETESATAGGRNDQPGSSDSVSVSLLTAGSANKCRSSASGSSSDTLLYDILKEANVECFSTLEDAIPFIEAYEVRSGNHLRVQRSLTDKFKQYQCREHVNCPFQVLISRRRSDGMFCVSKVKSKHSDVRRPARAADGRQWKTRRHAKLDGVIGQVVSTKQGVPVPGDVVKTAATKSGMVIDYMTAYRALTHETSAERRATIKNFEMIIPFLEAMKSCNLDSVIGYTRDSAMQLVEFHVFPGMMNRALKYVRPVISLDAAHLRSACKGTLYVASVLTGCNDVFPIGFMISAGNEDGDTWQKMLGLLKEACPIISTQGDGDVDNDGVVRPPFMFISDRDKGLKPALKLVFPDKYEMSCAKHIEANVAQKFGKQCARYVCAIAKTFSTRRSTRLFDEIRKVKPDAVKYLEDLTNAGVLWRSTQWYSAPTSMPPRYGIVTSNTSEAVNNMFYDARDCGWLDAVNKLVDIMSTRICTCRAKYMERHGSEVVPRVAQMLKKRWDAAASMTVLELEAGCGDFKVVEPSSLAEDSEDVLLVTGNGGQDRINIVKPDLQWCSCGVWQDFLYPCRHAYAVFRKWKEKEFMYVLMNLVHPYYTFEFVQSSFTNNIYPVCLETIEHDGETKEPPLPKQQPGRPKTKRLRKRSKYVELEESPIICSICGKRGHNRRTCPN